MPDPASRGPLTRRTALRVGLGGLGLGGLGALSGCSLDGIGVQVPGTRPSAAATPAGGAAPPSARDGGSDADEELVARLTTQLSPVLALVTRTAARHPGLRGRLTSLGAALQADLETLRDAVEESRLPSTTPSTTAVPADRAVALQAVVRTVTTLREQLRRGALSALSGRFARLIASMAAALSQRLRTLAPTPLATRVPTLEAGATSADDGGDSPLQTALAGEHAAVHVYGVLGAQTSESDLPETYARLLAAYTWHRACRDRLVAVLRARDVRPVAAAASYALPNAVSTPAQVLSAALVTEQRVTATYGRLVQETVASDRRWAVAVLEQSAVRQLLLDGTPTAFPGTSA